MSTDPHELFRPLDPPPGGARRFARLLDEAELAAATPAVRRRGFAIAFGAAACAALVLLAAIVWLEPRDSAPPRTANSEPAVEVYGAPGFDRLLGRPPPSSELVVQINDQAASITELETQNEKVRIYQIN
jgi:hypothetical protein